MLKDKLNADLKTAMLSRKTSRVELLRSLKSAILYAEVASNKREEGLNDNEILSVLKKESKKRSEASVLYAQGGNKDRADQELLEKEIIDAYLPSEMTEEQLEGIIDKILEDLDLDEGLLAKDTGKIIGQIKKIYGLRVDGAILANLVKKRVKR